MNLYENYVTTWNYAEKDKPNNNEKCIFHLKDQNEEEWITGYYIIDNSGVDSIMISDEIKSYSEVDFWMRVPKIPWVM